MKESMWNCPRIHETERQWDSKCGRRIGSFAIKREGIFNVVVLSSMDEGFRVQQKQAGWRRLPALEWWALGISVWLCTSLAGLSMISVFAHISKQNDATYNGVNEISGYRGRDGGGSDGEGSH